MNLIITMTLTRDLCIVLCTVIIGVDLSSSKGIDATKVEYTPSNDSFYRQIRSEYRLVKSIKQEDDGKHFTKWLSSIEISAEAINANPCLLARIMSYLGI